MCQCQHYDADEEKADARIKRQVMGWEVLMTMTKGKIGSGTWEQISNYATLLHTAAFYRSLKRS